MTDAQQLATAHQALDEISLICSGTLSHGADGNGVVEILEAISAKARTAIAKLEAANPTHAETAILDDNGHILGLGKTEVAARENAAKTILDSRSETEQWVMSAVYDAYLSSVSAELAADIRKNGGGVEYRMLRQDGKPPILVTVAECEAFCAARGTR
jgi:hypothetical protein